MNSFVKPVLEAFDLSKVTLEPSPLKEQYQQALDYFASIPSDDMLFGFRQRAGFPSPGKLMGGWYGGDDQERWYSGGHDAPNFGQWLSAFSRMAHATNDNTIREKALNLVAEWGKTIAPDGYFGAMSRRGASHISHYMFDKMVGGLVDAVYYLKSDEALRHLKTITEWAVKNLARHREPASPMHPSGIDGEWYTLSENLYRAYQFTGDELYKEFAEVWNYTPFWNDLAAGNDVFPGTHAYSHVNTLSGSAMAYAITGERHFLDTIVNGHDILIQGHSYATGGFGNRETFDPATGYMMRSLWDNINWWGYPSNFETPCGSWAVFKLNRYLMELTGEARFGDWIELLVYNGIGAALPMAGYGKTFYYSDYKETGGSKEYYPELWPCCSGTYPQAVTEYHNLIYFKDAEGIYINLFVPSTVEWQLSNKPVKITQETEFPRRDEVSIKVNIEEPTRFNLCLRVPGWLKQSLKIEINGKPENIQAETNTWLTINRIWQDGDHLKITLPTDLTFKPIYKLEPKRSALMKGPVVLVADKPYQLKGDTNNPDTWITPGKEPLTYHTQTKKGLVSFHPFYTIGEGKKYYMYILISPDQHSPYGVF